MKFREGSSRRQDVTLDLTSLIDVVFLLLLFFLVTASYSDDEAALPVDLPEGSAGAELTADVRVTVYIRSDGTVAVEEPDGTVADGIPREALADHMSGLRERTGAVPVFLRGDERVLYGEVVEVLDTCRGAGFQRVYNVIRGAPAN